MSQIIGWKDIKLSPQAEEALEQLQKGQVLAVRMKHTNGNKVQIEFAEKIDTPNPVRSALGLLNKSDDRFNFSSGARRSWETAEAVDAKAIFGFEIPEGQSHTELLKVLPEYKGLEFKLQITEMVESELRDDQRGEYLDNYLKRGGSKLSNYFYTPEGHRVASVVNLVTVPVGTEITHTYLKGSYKPMNQSIADALKSTAQIKAVI